MHVLPAPTTAPAPVPTTAVADPLPLPQPGWGAAQAREAVAEAALARPALAAPATVVRAVTTVVLRVGDQAVKVHPPGTDPVHLAAVHDALAGSGVALTSTEAPVVTSHGVVTVTPWVAPGRPVGWGELGRLLRALHDVPAALPAWTPLRRLPSQLAGLPEAGRLLTERAAALEALAACEPVLPAGSLHGDVSPENVLRTAAGPRWIDVDFAGTGPREYDLAAVVRRHASGELTDPDYRSFVRAYGLDLRGWTGLAVMDELCRLSAIGFRLWTDRCAGRPSDWLGPVPAQR